MALFMDRVRHRVHAFQKAVFLFMSVICSPTVLSSLTGLSILALRSLKAVSLPV